MASLRRALVALGLLALFASAAERRTAHAVPSASSTSKVHAQILGGVGASRAAGKQSPPLLSLGADAWQGRGTIRGVTIGPDRKRAPPRQRLRQRRLRAHLG